MFIAEQTDILGGGCVEIVFLHRNKMVNNIIKSWFCLFYVCNRYIKSERAKIFDLVI